MNKYTIYRCKNCEVELAVPMNITKKSNPVSYDRGYFTGKLKGVCGYQNYQRLDGLFAQESERKMRIIDKYVSGNELLDVGAGTGFFLTYAKSRGYKVTGNDISDFAVKIIKKKGLPVLSGSIEKVKLPPRRFDLITAWDVVEHLADFKAAFVNLVGALKPGGFLFLTTPFTDSVDCRLLGSHWYGYKKIPEHMIFFNTKSMKLLLTNTGLKTVSVVPWGFVRDVDFLLSKFANSSAFFEKLVKLARRSGLARKSAFIPLTDYLIVAKRDK